MTIPKFKSERRGRPRRAVDRIVDNLQKSFRSYLEYMADGVLLLNSETQVIYATPPVDQIVKKHGFPFELSPKFILRHQHHAARFSAFVNGKNQETGPLSLLLESECGRDLLLLNCFQLPKPAQPDLQSSCYMITLRDPSHYSSQQWRIFIEQFNLTPAEARLCRTLADGLTLSDYREQWKVADSTARSQLSSVFGKTSTRRQSDLLRLIFLFTRT